MDFWSLTKGKRFLQHLWVSRVRVGIAPRSAIEKISSLTLDARSCDTSYGSMSDRVVRDMSYVVCGHLDTLG